MLDRGGGAPISCCTTKLSNGSAAVASTREVALPNSIGHQRIQNFANCCREGLAQGSPYLTVGRSEELAQSRRHALELLNMPCLLVHERQLLRERLGFAQGFFAATVACSARRSAVMFSALLAAHPTKLSGTAG
jgi:hypothetical protein